MKQYPREEIFDDSTIINIDILSATFVFVFLISIYLKNWKVI